MVNLVLLFLKVMTKIQHHIILEILHTTFANNTSDPNNLGISGARWCTTGTYNRYMYLNMPQLDFGSITDQSSSMKVSATDYIIK